MTTKGPRWITFGEETVISSTPLIITNDLILTIPNSPWIEIVPAPNSGQYILPLFTVAIQDFTGGAYGGVNTGSVFADVGYIDGSSFFALSGSPLDVEGAFIDFSNLSEWHIAAASQTQPIGRAGNALGFTVTNAGDNFTDGDASNTLTVQTFYTIRTI